VTVLFLAAALTVSVRVVVVGAEMRIPLAELVHFFLLTFVNCHGTGVDRDVGTGLFPYSSLFNHSCAPNCAISTVLDDHVNCLARSQRLTAADSIRADVTCDDR
jgi:hypothetical protein